MIKGGGRLARHNGEAGTHGGETPPVEGGRPARQSGDPRGGDTPPLQAHGGDTPPLQAHGGDTPPLREHRGWYIPRKLPHFDAAGLTQTVTFRLADSLPAGIIEARRGEGAGAYRRRIEAALDAGRGSCMLRDPKNAEIVETALRHGAGRYYDLHAYVIMPNHVHALITQHEAARLADIVHRWKGWSAKLINRLTGRSGQFWQRDYFDRFIRDEEHFHAVFAYIEQNPVVAGLVTAAADWRFGSAWRRDEA